MRKRKRNKKKREQFNKKENGCRRYLGHNSIYTKMFKLDIQ